MTKPIDVDNPRSFARARGVKVAATMQQAKRREPGIDVCADLEMVNILRNLDEDQTFANERTRRISARRRTTTTTTTTRTFSTPADNVYDSIVVKTETVAADTIVVSEKKTDRVLRSGNTQSSTPINGGSKRKPGRPRKRKSPPPDDQDSVEVKRERLEQAEPVMWQNTPLVNENQISAGVSNDDPIEVHQAPAAQEVIELMEDIASSQTIKSAAETVVSQDTTVTVEPIPAETYDLPLGRLSTEVTTPLPRELVAPEKVPRHHIQKQVAKRRARLVNILQKSSKSPAYYAKPRCARGGSAPFRIFKNRFQHPAIHSLENVASKTPRATSEAPLLSSIPHETWIPRCRSVPAQGMGRLSECPEEVPERVDEEFSYLKEKTKRASSEGASAPLSPLFSPKKIILRLSPQSKLTNAHAAYPDETAGSDDESDAEYELSDALDLSVDSDATLDDDGLPNDLSGKLARAELRERLKLDIVHMQKTMNDVVNAGLTDEGLPEAAEVLSELYAALPGFDSRYHLGSLVLENGKLMTPHSCSR